MKNEFKVISDLIEENKKVLDVGCADGTLMQFLKENKDIVIALNSIGADVGFVEIVSDKGHDSFLLDVPDFLNALKNFLDKSYIELKNEKWI